MSKDTDRLILEKLEDRDLFNAMLSNKYFYSLTDENFWKRRLLNKYPTSLEYKKEGETWKQYYLKVVYYSDILQRKYNFTFTKGDPLFYYNFFKGNYTIGMIEQYEMMKSGHEDLSLYMVNFLRKNYKTPLLKMGTKEWEEYKNDLISVFERNKKK